MQRRAFIHTGLAAGALGVTGAAASQVAGSTQPDAGRRHFELRIHELRSDINSGRIRTYFKDALVPALGRAGAASVGVFSPDTGFPTQSVMTLIEYPSLAAVERVAAELDADAAFTTEREAFERGDDLPFVRYDARLMRAFPGQPRVVVPAPANGGAGRMFELRTYEARSAAALERKIAMFDEAEVALFKQIGMTPVFFGEDLFGTRLPSLTYMLVFDDIAARTKAWATFGSHPEWKRINGDPKYAANGSVTVTNVAYLKPLPFSPIR